MLCPPITKPRRTLHEKVAPSKGSRNSNSFALSVNRREEEFFVFPFPLFLSFLCKRREREEKRNLLPGLLCSKIYCIIFVVREIVYFPTVKIGK